MIEVFFRGYGTWHSKSKGMHLGLSDETETIGRFKLAPGDEEDYRRTGSLDRVKVLLKSPNGGDGNVLDGTEQGYIVDFPGACVDAYFLITPHPENILHVEETRPLHHHESEPSYLDATHPMYSDELAKAIEAWQAVLSNNPPRPKSGSRKKMIEDYLRSNHRLDKAQIDRISTMLNPDKNGGAPKSE